MLKALSLAESIRYGAYQAYSYSYPHKSAYRALIVPRALDAVRSMQDRSALFAYVHVSFCTMRCGFCNLFAMAQPDDALVNAYVDAMLRQMQVMHRVLGERRFARLALGGGTPSFLTAAQLERLYAGAQRWLASLDSALAFAPEELYLYPLYVRAQTGLGKLSIRQADAGGDDRRQPLYATARERLRDAGYRQISMRMFRAPHAPQDEGPVYCCQDDGMVGLGAGARSYTRTLHWSTGYAIERAATRHIVEDFIAHAMHGFELNGQEQRRRYVIQSLLTEPGLSHAAYAQRFGNPCLGDLPQLQELTALELAHDDGKLLALNDRGIAYADTIGPWRWTPGSGCSTRRCRRAACRAGSEVLSVDGEGELRRCHFIPQRIGNLYTDPLDRVLQERRCSRLRCECFIGYAHRRDLPLHEQFGDGLLVRIPIAAA